MRIIFGVAIFSILLIQESVAIELVLPKITNGVAPQSNDSSLVLGCQKDETLIVDKVNDTHFFIGGWKHIVFTTNGDIFASVSRGCVLKDSSSMVIDRVNFGSIKSGDRLLIQKIKTGVDDANHP